METGLEGLKDFGEEGGGSGRERWRKHLVGKPSSIM
jgi:hypothetical protein